MVNPLSLIAAKAAYDYGNDLLKEFRVYLDDNFAFVKAFLNEYLPQARMNISVATYLAWVDVSGCLPDVNDLPGFFANQAGVLLEDGSSMFVGNARAISV